MEYTIGKKYWYHEMGIIFEVEVLDVQETEPEEHRDEGIELELKVTGNIKQLNPALKMFDKDHVFKVWKSEGLKGYGWHLMDE